MFGHRELSSGRFKRFHISYWPAGLPCAGEVGRKTLGSEAQHLFKDLRIQIEALPQFSRAMALLQQAKDFL